MPQRTREGRLRGADSACTNDRGSDTAAHAPTRLGLSAQDLSPSIFAVVMATGIVSLALNGAGWPRLARGLFWLNVAVYAILGILLAIRAVRYRTQLTADFQSHARAPGFFTLVAAPACSAASVCCSSE